MLNILFTVLMLILPPCEAEDSQNCYWSGGVNGQGLTFVDIGGTAYYETR